MTPLDSAMKITVEIDHHNTELDVMDDQLVITAHEDSEEYVSIKFGTTQLIVNANELMEALSKFV